MTYRVNKAFQKNKIFESYFNFQIKFYSCCIIQEPDHPVTSNLLKNPRSTSVLNLCKTKIAKTEAHNQTFVSKYLRMLRDKRNDLYKHTNTKRLINSKQQHNTNQTNTIAQLKHKTSHTVTSCLNWGTMVKSKKDYPHTSDSTKDAKSQQYRML